MVHVNSMDSFVQCLYALEQMVGVKNKCTNVLLWPVAIYLLPALCYRCICGQFTKIPRPCIGAVLLPSLHCLQLHREILVPYSNH